MEFVQVTSYNNYVEANIALSLLQDEDISCHLLDENTASLINVYGGMRLMVHPSQVDRAIGILKNVELEFLKTVECPRCHSPGLKIKYVSVDMGRFLPRLVSRLINLLSKEGTRAQVKHYVCENCGKEYEELPLNE